MLIGIDKEKIGWTVVHAEDYSILILTCFILFLFYINIDKPKLSLCRRKRIL